MDKLPLISFYRTPALTDFQAAALVAKAQEINSAITGIHSEWRYLIDSTRILTREEELNLHFILSETFDPEGFGSNPLIDQNGQVFQTGPKITMPSSWSNSMTRICNRCGLSSITRLERVNRFVPVMKEGSAALSDEQMKKFLNLVHDFMVEQPYPEGLKTFDLGVEPIPAMRIPVLKEGLPALQQANKDLGANLDDYTLKFIHGLCKKYRRDPTDMFLFQCGQGISEHSRHPWYNSIQVVDGERKPHTLMELIKMTTIGNERNSISHFSDNSSVIEGYDCLAFVRDNPLGPSQFKPTHVRYEITFNGETHNYPTAVKPFPGAATGTGGRIRDNIMTGLGGRIVAGTAAYLVGHLFLEGYPLPWEVRLFPDPKGIELPKNILIEASNGASDYGNKVGEPVIQGSARSFEMEVDGTLYGYRKCIMFTAGVGQIRTEHVKKGEPKAGLVVARFGGDSVPVGVGGGGRSSDIIKQDESEQAFDASGVQRDNPWMENLGVHVMHACGELGPNNPVVVAHDSGAGGMSNVGPEIVYATGGYFYFRRIPMGDKSMGDMVFWTNESQEVNLVLVKPENLHVFQSICERYGCPMQVVGFTTGDGEFTLYDEWRDTKPVQFNMEDLLGDKKEKDVKELTSKPLKLKPFRLPLGINVRDALERVLRLVDVASKRFLTTKVDRSVTGLIAQQQTVGPTQLPLADVAVVANSMLDRNGAAISMGEQPIYGLIDPAAMVRMSVAEALLNLAAARIENYNKIYFCGNWMWAAKLPGEGVRLYNAVEAVSNYLRLMGLGINAGKDSLSMACETIVEEVVRKILAPGTFVASAYAPIPDITKVVTPDIKLPGQSHLMFLDLGKGRTRMGGSVLGRVYNTLGMVSPDMEDGRLLGNAFRFLQELIERDLILAYHDRSDGGLLTTLLEMAFAGNCGFDVHVDGKDSKDITAVKQYFNQEAGAIVEAKNHIAIRQVARQFGLNHLVHTLGPTRKAKSVKAHINRRVVLNEDMRVLRDVWEETAFQLEARQANPETVQEERHEIYDRTGMGYKVNYTWRPTKRALYQPESYRPRVAIVSDEGSNSENEMSSAWHLGGWEPWDVHVTDLLKGYVDMSMFRAQAWVGGFTYSDAGDAGKGMASVIRFNRALQYQQEKFMDRGDTMGFYVCNGAQAACLNGIVPYPGIDIRSQPRLIWGRSHRFESRFVMAKILQSNSIFLQGMEDSVLGVWVANGEGKLHFPDGAIEQEVRKLGLAPIRYVNDQHRPTEVYPFNPSGSPDGMVGLSSKDGRHLAIMPHPERSVLLWQWAYTPRGWRRRLGSVSPWIKLFQNAYEWAASTEDLSRQPLITAPRIAA